VFDDGKCYTYLHPLFYTHFSHPDVAALASHILLFYFYKGCTDFNGRKKKKMLKKRRKQEGIAGALDGWRRECQTRAQAWGRVSGEKDGLGKAGSNGENGRLLRRARAWVCGWVSTERGGLGKAGSNGESGRFPVCRTLGFQ
jgi:hypothetical protein